MEESPERAMVVSLLKEQEREKRRMRDRERRQSMTVEERETHLARRRRNYQLRRQRSLGNAQVGGIQTEPNFDQSSLAMNRIRTEIILVPSDVQPNGIGLEVSDQKLEKLPVRSRLSHIKHVARSIDDDANATEANRINVDLIKGWTTQGQSSKGLRLNQLKSLARASKSDATTDS